MRRINSGPGRLLLAVYGTFAVAASSRALYQLATKFSDAPVAYVLSAFAAVVYIVATVALALGKRQLALIACGIELAGVILVGIWSLVQPAEFPDETVWSIFGRGYGFIPLILPILGLLWLRRRD
ncbi:membrane protein [Virgisporangium aliadipatigenens]|uniref:Membrane protein n=1 Tax=Virgisporangium aliadipatigenens TaxID=741659 RepID=A0A8J3YN16_9ACTN|nr:hypothetical protein [Virgisporangium aliadipatigenens]GIJ47317.1 membrane protein [Virgisporangium aliadipatigenens]